MQAQAKILKKNVVIKIEVMKQLNQLLPSVLRCGRVTDVIRESSLVICMNCVSDKCDMREVMTF